MDMTIEDIGLRRRLETAYGILIINFKPCGAARFMGVDRLLINSSDTKYELHATKKELLELFGEPVASEGKLIRYVFKFAGQQKGLILSKTREGADGVVVWKIRAQVLVDYENFVRLMRRLHFKIEDKPFEREYYY